LFLGVFEGLPLASNNSEEQPLVKTPADLPEPVRANPDPAAPVAGTLPHLTWGAANIGKVINRSTNDVYYLHKVRAIPTRVVGNRIVANTAKLLALAD
jgi:hypothetical protein